MMVATMVPEKDSIYAIAYFDSPPDFDKFLPVIERMIDSFQINAKGPVIQEDNSSSISPLTENQSNSPFTDPCSPLNLVLCETK